MPSIFSTRTYLASRCIRAMAMFAWLLLVVSLPATSMGNNVGAMHRDTSTDRVSMAGHGMHLTMATGDRHAADCCGNPSHASCHCEAMCANVLLPTVPTVYGPALLADHYESLRGADAPMLDPIPPLRPPAV